MAKVLVTGGAGFIGSHLVDRLVADGHDVVVLDNLSTGKREYINQGARLVECDIGDYEAIAGQFDGVEAVFHLAAKARIQGSISDPLLYNKTNITGTLNVLWAAKNAGVKKVVYSASSSAYGDQKVFPVQENFFCRPKTPYGLQKMVGEEYCRIFSELYDLPTVALRYFNAYGPRQVIDGPYPTVIGLFLEQSKNGKPMTIIGDGEQRRDFTYISDVVEANIRAWQSNVGGGELFNIGTGRNHSMNEVAAIIGGPTVNIPLRPGEARISLADNTKAKRLLGWEPKVTLQEGIAKLKAI
ncbi:MAG: SDR family oxidoreductase [Candidatus Doudnabacteria bacterium]|nr:SDR family oxidoreductase [bacterium]MDZ4243817.1 SDR family oxidoreductase [Candidatus Doudnabacteria bacterium]